MTHSRTDAITLKGDDSGTIDGADLGNLPREVVLPAPDDLHPAVERLAPCQFERPRHGSRVSPAGR
jgi:hypothetical protein